MDLYDQFVRELRIRHLSPKTVSAYCRSVREFLALFDGRDPRSLGLEEVRQYQQSLIDRGLSASSINLGTCALRFFLTRILSATWEPGAVPYAKRGQKLPEVLSESEVEALLAACGDPRYRTILTTIYACGLRVSEAIKLRVSDIDSERMVLRISGGKGNKDRYVMLGVELLDRLRAYWRLYRPADYLFAGPSGGPISSRSVQRALKAALRTAGITKAITVHSLRHAFATHMLEQGTSVRVLQALLGHRKLATTERYTHLIPGYLGRARSPLDVIAGSRMRERPR